MRQTKEQIMIVANRAILAVPIEILSGSDSYPDMIVACKHCGKSTDHANIIGLSSICPSCGKVFQ